MADIKVSVLVTFYNQIECVDRALGSVFSQHTDFDFEVLVGDDGSDDGTITKIREWIEKYPQRLHLYIMDRSENKKYFSSFRASQNRLNLLKHVKGEYFILLDGDDYFCDENKLQSQVEILDDINNKDCIACGHQFLFKEMDGKVHEVFNIGLKDGKVSAKNYWKYYYFHTNTLLIRSKVISELPVELLNNYFSDWMIVFSVIQHGDLYYLSKPMVEYVISNSGIWTGEKKVVNHISSLLMVDFTRKIGPLFEKESQYRLAETYYEVLKLHKEIKNAQLDSIRQEAQDKGCYEALKWINYPNSAFYKKILLLCEATYRARRIIISRAFHRLHGFLYRTYHIFFKKKLFTRNVVERKK